MGKIRVTLWGKIIWPWCSDWIASRLESVLRPQSGVCLCLASGISLLEHVRIDEQLDISPKVPHSALFCTWQVFPPVTPRGGLPNFLSLHNAPLLALVSSQHLYQRQILPVSLWNFNPTGGRKLIHVVGHSCGSVSAHSRFHGWGREWMNGWE